MGKGCDKMRYVTVLEQFLVELLSQHHVQPMKKILTQCKMRGYTRSQVIICILNSKQLFICGDYLCLR